ncbi:uncharacterized protein LOC120426900 [Culex pipiens pallens]|uniref:uncharacterized protein LOC120426900 n=1 Tax=Culex pipiens pallens TaxID=42434 RepID=UPI0022AA4AE1|nr:uncharacterized protein LOC120426900 [Culex pipiens pallens]
MSAGPAAVSRPEWVRRKLGCFVIDFDCFCRMGGRNVDTNRLYSVMVTRGWWLKVDSREDWDEIIEEMALPTRCVNKKIALKKNNIRFLDKYEKGSDEEEDGKKRHNRRWSARMLHSMSAVHNTATSRPQTLTSRRRSFSWGQRA